MSRNEHAKRNQNSWMNMVFIDAKLTVEQGEAFMAWRKAKPDNVEPALEKLFSDGYRMSLSWDDQNSCFIASITIKSETHENRSKCLTARSDDLFEVMAMAAYKHVVLFEGGGWDGGKTRDAWG